jgi:hypothetical protein
MSFKAVEDMVLGITQDYFSEQVTYTQGAVAKTIGAVFVQDWVESGGVSTYALTARISSADIAVPGKGDTILRNAKTYKVTIAQADSFGGFTLVLNET